MASIQLSSEGNKADIPTHTIPRSFTQCTINYMYVPMCLHLLSTEWNSIRLSGPAHGIVTKTVHKLCQGRARGRGGQGGRGWWESGVVGCAGGQEGRGGGSQGW